MFTQTNPPSFDRRDVRSQTNFCQRLYFVIEKLVMHKYLAGMDFVNFDSSEINAIAKKRIKHVEFVLIG